MTLNRDRPNAAGRERPAARASELGRKRLESHPQPQRTYWIAIASSIKTVESAAMDFR